MSKELTKRERKARIRKGLPIEALGLQFYPVLMADYEEFLECKSALAIRQTSLAKSNIEYLSMPFLAALWAMELDSIRATGKAIGMFERIIRLLYLTLRLEYDSEKAFNNIACEHDNPRNLLFIQVKQNDGEPVKISPAEFTAIVRPLIAEQNGIDLPDESFNPELVETERIMQEKATSKIKYDIDTLIASVANASCLRERELDDWSVVEFERRKQAIDREKHYAIYKQAEMSGMVTFKSGNPYQSWCFDGADTIPNSLMSIEALQEAYKATGDINTVVSQTQNNT